MDPHFDGFVGKWQLLNLNLPNPLIRSIGNYSLADLHHQYKKYIRKRPKHILL